MDANCLNTIVKSALQSGNWQEFDAWIFEESSFVFEAENRGIAEPIPDEVAQSLISVLEKAESIPTWVARTVVLFFQSEWQRWSSDQRDFILGKLEKIYLNMLRVAGSSDNTDDDNLAAFLFGAVELLGRFYANQDALDILFRLLKATRGEHRALVVTGIGYLTRSTSAKPILADAVHVLKRLRRSDHSLEVRKEARICLARLGIRKAGRDIRRDERP